jgi:hypothetical protein
VEADCAQVGSRSGLRSNFGGTELATRVVSELAEQTAHVDPELACALALSSSATVNGGSSYEVQWSHGDALITASPGSFSHGVLRIWCAEGLAEETASGHMVYVSKLLEWLDAPDDDGGRVIRDLLRGC